DLGIIGEPTEMHLAIAEKGLIVIDATTKGVSGHAARDVGTNALYLACEDIQRIRDHQWSKTSDVLGATKTTVTQIQSGRQHNVIPDDCSYVIDCRVNENYSLHEVLRQLEGMTHATLTPRSLKWSPSGINPDHPIVKRGQMLGRRLFGSPTLSDQVHFSCPTIKVGPGKSERSHTIDEFIYVNEVMEAVQIYRELLIGLDLG
ncbi:MAG: peptidase dimerization domain-containing protein, partial [Bacteroidota bacterium]